MAKYFSSKSVSSARTDLDHTADLDQSEYPTILFFDSWNIPTGRGPQCGRGPSSHLVCARTLGTSSTQKPPGAPKKPKLALKKSFDRPVGEAQNLKGKKKYLGTRVVLGFFECAVPNYFFLRKHSNEMGELITMSLDQSWNEFFFARGKIDKCQASFTFAARKKHRFAVGEIVREWRAAYRSSPSSVSTAATNYFFN